MTKRTKRRAHPARSRHRYRPTPISGLFLHPTILLLNLVIRNADDNARTDGKIPPETVDVVTAIIRNTYDLPDLDLDQGTGVLLSCIGQFFHPDDYDERRIAEMHSQGVLDALRGDLLPQPLRVSDLRTTTVADPADLARGRERTLALWYKQRFLSLCFVGEKVQLDKLRDDIPPELLNQILGVIWEGVDLGQEAYVIPHPAFVPVSRFRKVSQQNAIEWAEQMKQFMAKATERGTVAELSIVGPPGPTYTVRPRKRK
jgi:uncharacterized protein YifN (PemK superfamily)